MFLRDVTINDEFLADHKAKCPKKEMSLGVLSMIKTCCSGTKLHLKEKMDCKSFYPQKVEE